MKQQQRKNTWGGAREGAGRHKSKYTELVSFKVTPEMKQLIEKEAENYPTQSDFLRCVLNDWLGFEEE